MEAARRAWKNTNDLTLQTDPFNPMEDAAREALAPIRALHRKHTDGEEESYCVECCHIYGDGYELTYQPWPCDTARLIYTSSELEVGA